MSDAYSRATEAIEGVLNEYFGGLTHRFVVVATGIDHDGKLREKLLVPDRQLYSDTLGQIDYARMVLDVEMRAHYMAQLYIAQQMDEGDEDDDDRSS